MIHDESSFKFAFDLLTRIFITEPILERFSDLNNYKEFLKELWIFLKEYILANEKYLFLYIEFLLFFLNECQNNDCLWPNSQNTNKVIGCQQVLEILEDITTNLLFKKATFQYFQNEKALITSYIMKISAILSKETPCGKKSKNILKTIISHPFIFQQIIQDEELLCSILTMCFEIQTQDFFLFFLTLSYPKLQVLSDEGYIFRNRFFEIIRKYLSNFNNFSIENSENKPINLGLWKINTIAKFFTNLLINKGTQNLDFEKYTYDTFEQNFNFLASFQEIVFQRVIKLKY